MHPLINTFEELNEQRSAISRRTLTDDYPTLHHYLESLSQKMGCKLDPELRFVCDFLVIYGRKSAGTFNRFRNEIERFCLFCWEKLNKSIFEIRRRDLEHYIEFVWKPELGWVGTSVQQRFVLKQGQFIINPQWRPFVAKIAKSELKKDSEKEVDPKEYRISSDSLNATFTALNVFYKHALLEDRCEVNFVPVVKKNCPYLIKKTQIRMPETLSELQWEYVFGVTQEKAEEDKKYERNLFLLACLKGLYLRISEVSERPNWTPLMNNFWMDNDGFWFYRVLGKGNKVRDVTLSDDFLDYLKRYRLYRGLSPLPSPDEQTPVIAKLRGSGNMSSRQLRRIVQESFDLAIEQLKLDGFSDDANDLLAATTHWLRHTGATDDADKRPLKHLSEDLGHASMTTTDAVYIQSNIKDRAKTGKGRKL